MNYQKLLLVGETMAGKTSLAQTLMNSSSQLTTDQQRTVVLEQHTWPAEGGLEIQINDFGGHEMYHLTSPCFFTPNVPYLLIFDIKKYTRQTHHKDIGCWIDIVRMKVPRATIRMVGTHQDECSSEEIGEKLQYIAQTVQNDEAKWKADITSQLDMIESNECLGDLTRQHRQECLQTHLNNLPNLHEPDSPVEIRTVSSSDLGGIDSLSSDIRELCKQVGSNRQDTIPKIWFDLYEMIQATEYDNQHFVHLDDLQPYLKEWDELEALKLHEAPTQKLEFESDDDEFYMYEEESDIESDDDGDDTNVGQFSKQGFARAVQEFESTANLSVAIVRCLWHKLGFSKEDIESLIKLMIKFDICYEVLESKVAPGLQSSHSLHIPWYLSADPPQELFRMWPQPPPDDYQQLTMQYHFPTFCPRGLFERASIRLHRHIAHRVNWKNGVWAEVDNRQILLSTSTTDDESGREVVFNLSVRAPVTDQEPGHAGDISQLWKTFLSIHRDMQSVIQDWPGLRCDLFLQCAHCAKMGKDKPSVFPGEVLEQQCQQDVRTIPCPQYPVIFPVPKVSTDLVYPPKSCMRLASETSDDHASIPVSEMDRLHQGIDTCILQQVTALVQKKYPGISFVPSRDRQDEAQRTTTVREFHDQLSSQVQHFSSVTDYSIDYEDFPTITERMKSVCLLECPKGTATGFLDGVVIVVGHPGGQRKRVDFCPIAVVDQNFEVHIRNVRGIPDNPVDFPQQMMDIG
ncbi:hypothetical protein Bbelb_029970 [Branchiostoma belcheri]|nr:hypothetical protein Bbelb_029970 [Branchiostoma belcheri]